QNGFLSIGTSSPGSKLSVQAGNAQVTGTTTTHALIATSTLLVGGTTGTSLYVGQSGNVGIGTTTPSSLFSVHGSSFLGTTTVAGLTATGTLNVLGTTASSTFANGIQLTNGCYRLANGNCAADGGTTGTVITNGTSNRLTYYSSPNTLNSANYLTTDVSNRFLGIATSTPAAHLSVAGNVYLDSTLITIGSSSPTSLSTSTIINIAQIATTTISSSTINAFSFSKSTSSIPLLSFDTLNSRIGMGTATPGSLLSIQAGDAQVTGTSTTHALIATSTLFVGAQGQLFNVSQNGRVGVATTSPGSLLSIQANSQVTGTSTTHALVATSSLLIGANVTNNNEFLFFGQNGFLSIGTSSPGSKLSVQAGNLQVTGTSTAHALHATSSLTVTGATSTLAGLNISSGGLRISNFGVNCDNLANGGALTTDATGMVICSDDDSSGGAVTLNTGTTNA
ncbi:MAG: hypothetical protein AAB799_01320, partial [Patescibacteria group bacterium]